MYPEFQGPLQVFCGLTGVFSCTSAQKCLLPGVGAVHLKAFSTLPPPPLPGSR